jgi:prepilin-type N-terminal cleavage/methylation domain-containing protein
MLSNRKGFTLIELLIVVVIIGILAAIAIPKFANTKEKAYVTAMKADLKNLGTAQEAYFSTHNTYAASNSALGATNLSQSAGVTITIGSGDGSSWAATAAHASTTKTCSITAGGTATTEGVPICN